MLAPPTPRVHDMMLMLQPVVYFYAGQYGWEGLYYRTCYSVPCTHPIDMTALTIDEDVSEQYSGMRPMSLRMRQSCQARVCAVGCGARRAPHPREQQAPARLPKAPQDTGGGAPSEPGAQAATSLWLRDP
mmetsp:Transcript_5213/g.9327  ORF Transcript_5213/g.9327 Transcript_5213/m.9327 type:complete len:130 (-) Transcript_5213:151-540(-)